MQSGNCTLREATIVGSVISKVSIPVSHAAVVLLKLAMARDYDAPCSIFLKVSEPLYEGMYMNPLTMSERHIWSSGSGAAEQEIHAALPRD